MTHSEFNVNLALIIKEIELTVENKMERVC
jgi:hypothetical protein